MNGCTLHGQVSLNTWNARLPFLLLHLEVATTSDLYPPALPWALPRRAPLHQNEPSLASLSYSPRSGNAAAVSSISPAAVAADAAKTPSECLPSDTVILVWANRHHRPLFSAQINTCSTVNALCLASSSWLSMGSCTRTVKSWREMRSRYGVRALR